MTLQEVIEKNRAQQERARKLNARAGKTVFMVYTVGMVEKVLADLLPKAKRVADIPFPEDFLLPPLDEAEAARVMAENPDTMSVLGRDRAVMFRHGLPPQVTVDVVELGDLPAEIHLPDGRAVEAMVFVDRHSFANTDLQQLKERVRECLNQEQWDKWRMSRQEERWAHLDFPPTVKTEGYGKCALTGEVLQAYGVATKRVFTLFDATQWRMVWFRTREEAEREQEISMLRFEAEREKAALESMVSTRRIFFGEFAGAEKRARDFLWPSIPADPAGLKNWIATAKAHHAELLDSGRRADADHARKLEQMRQAEATVPIVTVADLGAKFNRKRR